MDNRPLSPLNNIDLKTGFTNFYPISVEVANLCARSHVGASNLTRSLSKSSIESDENLFCIIGGKWVVLIIAS